MANESTVPTTEPLFRITGLAEGYDCVQVEAFLQDVLAELDGPLPNGALAERIRDTLFTPVRFRRGYDMDEVDEALDELEVLALRGRH